ncbi:hypothetical protein [Rickettsia amblyommatis]|uniref:Uncharacterized protein n=1 Tax=Rickettsia amblyommatis str. Ac/Pa TaxID=1359164 RepID=A0A0F3N2H7_RICAM|nr:hypothetical protein [Rickettsia amblyommatis]KJV62275.1 hypothetical protein APHACPA_1297 [Rickettsia amblyommatis str. Ac/Pa]
MTVALQPIVSPIQPNIKALIGLNTYVAQYAMAEYREAARASTSGTNSSDRHVYIEHEIKIFKKRTYR